VTVRVTDSYGGNSTALFLTATISIAVTNVPEPPTAVTLNGLSRFLIPERTANGFLVGVLRIEETQT
jgi:hypothetical protein